MGDQDQPFVACQAAGSQASRTLGDLLAAVDLGELLLNELVSLLADVDNVGTSNAELGHLGQHLLRDLGGRLVLGDGVGVVEGVVCGRVSAPSARRENPGSDVSGRDDRDGARLDRAGCGNDLSIRTDQTSSGENWNGPSTGRWQASAGEPGNMGNPRKLTDFLVFGRHVGQIYSGEPASRLWI